MLWTYTVLCLSAALAGAINSVAGGGTLLTFPALFAALGSVPNAGVIANATSTVALMPGSLAGLWAYRREMREAPRWTLVLIAPSLLGGLAGALLVVLLPPEMFKAMVPWLILLAALLFALQPQISRWTGIGRPVAGPGTPPENEAGSPVAAGAGSPATAAGMAGVIVFQLLIAVYGGYFGAGIGILMLTALALIGMSDIHQMNALKSLLASLINGVSVLVFIGNGVVNWRLAGMMAVAAIIGGYLGASLARKIDRQLVRNAVVAIGFALAGYYFYQQFA